ncbi:MAG: peptide chain release factor 1, partial [Candidatus Diapherotrites archaeon]|nr:peptide chain release factor 1 [Candidatus Diapherotrites archaeon]
ERELLDYRLKEKIMGILDNSYTDESGIREIIQKSDELLKDAEITRERTTVNRFFEKVVKGDLATYGPKEVEDALTIGKASELFVSEGIEWIVIKKRCEKCPLDEEKIIQNPLEYDEGKERCSKCGGPIEILEQVDYVDWILEKAKESGADTHVISVDTAEGTTFYKGFGGLGAILRYR